MPPSQVAAGQESLEPDSRVAAPKPSARSEGQSGAEEPEDEERKPELAGHAQGQRPGPRAERRNAEAQEEDQEPLGKAAISPEPDQNADSGTQDSDHRAARHTKGSGRPSGFLRSSRAAVAREAKIAEFDLASTGEHHT